jgi:hypothetical protein
LIRWTKDEFNSRVHVIASTINKNATTPQNTLKNTTSSYALALTDGIFEVRLFAIGPSEINSFGVIKYAIMIKSKDEATKILGAHICDCESDLFESSKACCFMFATPPLRKYYIILMDEYARIEIKF